MRNNAEAIVDDETLAQAPVEYGLDKIWAQLPRARRVGRGARFMEHAARAKTGIRLAPFGLIAAISSAGGLLGIVCLTLVLFVNMQEALRTARAGTALSVYLKNGTSDADIDRLEAFLVGDPEIQGVQRITREEALNQFRTLLGQDAGLLDSLGAENPLPQSLEVMVKPEFAARGTFARLARRLSEDKGVDRVVYSEDAVDTASQLLSGLRTVGVICGLGLVAITVLLVFNVLRLSVQAHRIEIGIMRLVGASEWFIRAQFLIEGILIGVGGATLGIVLGYGAFALLESGLQEIQLIHMLIPDAIFLPFGMQLAFVGFGACVGLLGTYFAVRTIAYD